MPGTAITPVDGNETDTSPLRLERSSFRDQAAGLLREQILAGRYASGSRLNEVEIAAAMGISRGPLREALQRLVVEGLVEVVPHRGAVVRTFTPVELRQMYEFRDMVESGAARLAAARASEDGVESLGTMLVATDKLLRHTARAPYPVSHDFHRRILELSGNPSLRQAGLELLTQVRIARHTSGRDPDRARVALDEHREIAAAIGRRDPEAAGAAMSRHLRHSLSSVTVQQVQAAVSDPD
jgi:DNA-binding GntR family transcriptional regulator